MNHILKCNECNVYTINSNCPRCGKDAMRPLPPKYSPEDKYGAYRRRVKSESLKKAELI